MHIQPSSAHNLPGVVLCCVVLRMGWVWGWTPHRPPRVAHAFHDAQVPSALHPHPRTMFTTSFMFAPAPTSPRKNLAFPMASSAGPTALNSGSSPAVAARQSACVAMRWHHRPNAAGAAHSRRNWFLPIQASRPQLSGVRRKSVAAMLARDSAPPLWCSPAVRKISLACSAGPLLPDTGASRKAAPVARTAAAMACHGSAAACDSLQRRAAA